MDKPGEGAFENRRELMSRYTDGLFDREEMTGELLKGRKRVFVPYRGL